MSEHPFPVRAYVRPITGVQSMKSSRYSQLAYVDPFLVNQENQRPAALGGCGCGCNGQGACTGGKTQAVGHMGMAGNWYFYPQGERHMYGMDGFLDKPLFTVPIINMQVDMKKAIIGAGLLAALGFALKG